MFYVIFIILYYVRFNYNKLYRENCFQFNVYVLHTFYETLEIHDSFFHSFIHFWADTTPETLCFLYWWMKYFVLNLINKSSLFIIKPKLREYSSLTSQNSFKFKDSVPDSKNVLGTLMITSLITCYGPEGLSTTLIISSEQITNSNSST